METNLTSTNTLVVKVVMLKGEKGDKGEDGYNDTEIRGLISDETLEREREDARLEAQIAEVVTPDADGIVYSNATSGLTATNVQDAIDEVNSDVSTLSGTVSTLGGNVSTLQTQIVSTTEQETLLASGWNNSEYSITNAKITATSNQDILPATNITDAQLKEYQKANIVCIGQTTGSLTLKAFGTTPTNNIPILIIYRGVK